MIGNGIAALASTTALAPAGGQARRSAGSEGGFAETLDQAAKEGNPGASGKGQSNAPEAEAAAPDARHAQRSDFMASARWRNVAGEEPSAQPSETVVDEAGGENAAPDTETVEAAISSEELAEGTSEGKQDGLDAEGASEAGTSSSADETKINRELAAAANASGAKPPASGAKDIPAEETPREAGGSTGANRAELHPAAAEAGSAGGDMPSGRKAGEISAASAESGRPGKTGPSGQPESPAIDDAVSAPVTDDADGKAAVQSRSDGAPAKPELVSAKPGAGAITSSTAQGKISSGSPERSPATAVTNGMRKAENAAAPDMAADGASKSAAAAPRSDMALAQTTAADKPAPTVPIIQVSLGAAATGGTSPSGQVADAVARDLEELAPTRVAVSTNGAPGRPVRSIQLQLNPAELGTVNIRLHSVDGQLRVTIRAESDKTADMLSRDSDAIRAALRATGITSSEITVSVSRNDQAMQQQFAGQNRDTSGQWAGQDNRGNMSNESKNPNREGPSGNSHGPLGRGNADSGDADGNDRLFI